MLDGMPAVVGFLIMLSEAPASSWAEGIGKLGIGGLLAIVLIQALGPGLARRIRFSIGGNGNGRGKPPDSPLPYEIQPAALAATLKGIESQLPRMESRLTEELHSTENAIRRDLEQLRQSTQESIHLAHVRIDSLAERAAKIEVRQQLHQAHGGGE